MPHLVDGGLSIMQYVDDTIHFMEDDLDKAWNLKFLLSTFEQMFALKLTSIKWNSSALEKPVRRRLITLACLVVRKAIFRLNIWEFQIIIGAH